MNKYNDLEISLLSCILIKPELMEEVVLDDKYFVKTKRIWLFMKSFYKKFGTFDLTLMCSVVKEKYQLVNYLEKILDVEPTPALFQKYQQQLIDLYNEKEKDKIIIEKTYELANELLLRNITPFEFKKQIDYLYENIDEVFKNKN